MKESERPPPKFLRVRGTRLQVPADIPPRCRLPGDLGPECFAAPIQLPPEDGCPVIRATLADHAFVFGFVGDALLGNRGGEVLVSAASAFGLLPGEYTLESVGHLAPLVLVVTLPGDAADQIFEQGFWSQCFLDMAYGQDSGMRGPEPVGAIHPLPMAAQKVAGLLPTLPFCGRLAELIGSMSGLRNCGDLYGYLARGPCQHRTGKPRGQFPERFWAFNLDSDVPNEPPMSDEEWDRRMDQIRRHEERVRERQWRAVEQFEERMRRTRTDTRMEVRYWTPDGTKTLVVGPPAD